MKDSSPAPGNVPRLLLFSLLKTAEVYQMRIEAELKGIGLSRTLYVTLELLAKAGTPLAQRELAEGEECAPSNITQKIDRLEKEGLVRRVNDPADRRTILAELTPLGKERAAAGGRILARLQDDFDSRLSESDRETLGRILSALS